MFRRIWMLREGEGGGGGGGGDSAAAAAAGAAAPAAAAAAAGAGDKPFAEQLPEAIRGEAAFKDIKDLSGLASGYLHAQKMLGHDPKNLLVRPGPDDKEGWAKFFGALGRPEKPEGYKLDGLKFPDGQELKAPILERSRAAFHALGLTEAQATGVLGVLAQEMGTYGQEDAAEISASLNAATERLKTELGNAYETTKAYAMDAMRHYATPEFVQLLETAKIDGKPLGDHPGFVQVMGKRGRELAEDGLIGKRGAGGASENSPAEAKQKISALERDDGFMKAYRDKNAPGHADAVQKMAGLYQQAYPEPEQQK